jgi:PleD family two-component response regulator
MGGEVSVESEKNIGTTFSFTIYLQATTNEAKQDQTHAAVLNVEAKTKRILIVEDNKMNLFLIQNLLNKLGFSKIDVA